MAAPFRGGATQSGACGTRKSEVNMTIRKVLLTFRGAPSWWVRTPPAALRSGASRHRRALLPPPGFARAGPTDPAVSTPRYPGIEVLNSRTERGRDMITGESNRVVERSETPDRATRKTRTPGGVSRPAHGLPAGGVTDGAPPRRAALQDESGAQVLIAASHACGTGSRRRRRCWCCCRSSRRTWSRSSTDTGRQAGTSACCTRAASMRTNYFGAPGS